MIISGIFIKKHKEYCKKKDHGPEKLWSNFILYRDYYLKSIGATV